MPAAPLLITSGITAAAATAVRMPVDVHAQIQAVFGARQLILQELTLLDQQRTDLGRTASLAYSSDVVTNGVDPAKAVAARDAWKSKDTDVSTQQAALNDLLQLIESRIEEFKQTNKAEVSVVLRDQIASLSVDLSTQEKAEHLTEHQLKVLWNELRDVDPGCLATMAKESTLRVPEVQRKAVVKSTRRAARK
jgi:flagellar biosynthesis/type III secretory pathway chaperone